MRPPQAVVYGIETADDSDSNLALRARLASETRHDGTRLFIRSCASP